MRALILPDRAFLRREQSLLARLEVGLADEGIRVLHAVPVGWRAGSDLIGLYSTVVPYADTGFPFTHGLRAARLVNDATAAAPSESGAPAFDLVHAFGEGSWRIATETAAVAGAVLIMEGWKPAAAGAAARAVRRLGAGRVVLALSDGALATTGRSAAGGATIMESLWGVHLPPLASRQSKAEGVSSVFVAATGSQPRAIEAVLAGIARCGRPLADLMIFIDSDAAHRSGAWAAARRLGLQGSLSVIADLESRRDLILQGDLLVLPESAGEQRTLTLEAMASGMVVVAAKDPANSAVIDGRTCLCPPAANADGWTAVLREALSGSERVEPLRGWARAWVQEHRLASSHVAAVLKMYQAVGRPSRPVVGSAGGGGTP